MAKLSKRLAKVNSAIDKNKVYSLEEAVNFLKNNTTVKFDETLDIAVKLGVNPQHSDQLVRGVTILPHGTGKTVAVAVFAKGDKAQEAKDAGADIVGAEDLVEQIEKGEINFEKCIATPDMMAVLGRVAKILGPKGLMPNAKLGSVTVNVKDAVKAAKGGQIEFRVEKTGIIHCGLGKLSFSEVALVENTKVLFEALSKAKPTGAKGSYFVRATLSSTMGVGLKIDIASALTK